MTRLSYADVCELELSIDKLDEPLARLIAQALCDEINELSEEKELAEKRLKSCIEEGEEAQRFFAQARELLPDSLDVEGLSDALDAVEISHERIVEMGE